MQTLTFEQLPTAVADLSRKVDYLTSLLTAKTPQPPVVKKKGSDFISIDEAAEFLNLATSTIYGMVGRNEIPFMKKAKKLYFSRRELESWIRSGRKKTTTECANEVREDLKNRQA